MTRTCSFRCSTRTLAPRCFVARLLTLARSLHPGCTSPFRIERLFPCKPHLLTNPLHKRDEHMCLTALHQLSLNSPQAVLWSTSNHDIIGVSSSVEWVILARYYHSLLTTAPFRGFYLGTHGVFPARYLTGFEGPGGRETLLHGCFRVYRLREVQGFGSRNCFPSTLDALISLLLSPHALRTVYADHRRMGHTS